MALEDWDKDQNGNLALSQLMAWEAAGSPVAGVVRLQSVASPEQLTSKQIDCLQLALNKHQLRDLGEALLKLATQVEDQSAETQQ